MLTRRGSGILMHITSLPGGHGIGDFGPQAHMFADFLKSSGQGYWQVLPLNPVGSVHNGSPYSGMSAFAMNTLLISPEALHHDGWLRQDEANTDASGQCAAVDYAAVGKHKKKLLAAAAERFAAAPSNGRFEEFCAEQGGWLDDYATFAALSEAFGGKQWCDWPVELRDRHPDAIRSAQHEYRREIHQHKVMQYFAFGQWHKLKTYCRQQGVKIIGDMPIYVVYDSSDVWSHPELFKLDHSRRPTAVGGVPPDVFSKTGQLWGTPVYDWEAAKREGYRWWLSRISMNLRVFDLVRLDHFRGFAGYWEVPAGEANAMNGRWMPGPGEDFFKTVLSHIESPALIAEDLGVITADVRELIAKFRLPSMKVLLFAFDEKDRSSTYLPHNHMPNSVVYTGTHDNNTVRGWYEKDATKGEKRRLEDYLGREVDEKTAAWEFIRMAMMSSSMLAVLPMQDVLGLGAEARMNYPGKTRGNWKWRLEDGQAGSDITAKLRHAAEIYDRI
ncbi:MAG TPA: 4-alpha-glucanotransferase [Sedimentisphaerales bacterium]|nr:4-alpha-glucanotransferase [Sedimentisphaerales bacterium]